MFTKECGPSEQHLMGSNTWEGTYFVFVEPTSTEEVAEAVEGGSRDEGRPVGHNEAGS